MPARPGWVLLGTFTQSAADSFIALFTVDSPAVNLCVSSFIAYRSFTKQEATGRQV